MSREHLNGYALALFSLAKEEKKLNKYKEDAILMHTALDENLEYLHLLSSNRISNNDKEKMVNNAFKGVHKNLINFVLILSKSHKVVQASAILKRFVKYVNEDLKIKEGIVYSTSKLSPAKIKELEKRVSKQLGFKPTLINKLDAELISGFRIVVEDEVIEDSITSRLEQIKYQLLREEN